MKKILIAVALIAAMSANAQSYTREGNTFAVTHTATTRNVRANADSTQYTIQDGKNLRAIWIAKSGSCFYIRTSAKSGKEYRQYCPREMSAAICAELGREYKPTTKTTK